jgi:CBS domain-containing protein
MSGLAVFDPQGDQVGRVRDVVVVFRPGRERPRAIGLVVEVPGRRRVFLPMTRVTSIDGGQVISTGLVNMRRFEQRAAETLVLADLLDREVQLRDGTGLAVVEDVAIESERSREWVITKLFCRRGPATRRFGGRLRRRGETLMVDIDDVAGLATESAQSAVTLLATLESLKAVDLADVIHDLSSKRRVEVAAALDDEKLADVLEELPEDDQVEILNQLGSQRAAAVLEVMQPDDAADLLSELPEETAEILLQLMEPDEAEPLRRLLAYDEKTAGGLMTTDPVVLAPESSIAEALAVVRRAELTPALASAVFVCRPPLETPTGKFIGLVHIQRLLREPPAAAVGTVIDKDVEPLAPDAPLGRVTRLLATYNLVTVPVVDDQGRLLGAVTVDDVLDHILPEDWRDIDDHDADHDDGETGGRTEVDAPTGPVSHEVQTRSGRHGA